MLISFVAIAIFFIQSCLLIGCKGACTVVYCRLTCSPTRGIAASSILQPVDIDSEWPADGLPGNAISLAQQALSASKQAVSTTGEMKLIEIDDDDPLPFGLVLSFWLILTFTIILFCF